MLDACAPGYERRERVHNWLVTYGQLSFPRLPRDTHNKRRDPDIQIGHVRQMVKLFGILDCAKKYIEQLGH